MTNPFTDAAILLGQFVGGTEIAGLLLGLALTFAIFLPLVIFLGDLMVGPVAFGPLSIGIVFSVLVGWWPPWTIVFIGLFLVLVIVNPFGENAAA